MARSEMCDFLERLFVTILSINTDKNIYMAHMSDIITINPFMYLLQIFQK